MVGHAVHAGDGSIDMSATFGVCFPEGVLGSASGTLSDKPLSSAGEVGSDASVVEFVLRALGDSDAKVRETCAAVAVLMDSSALMPKMEHYLDTDGNGEPDADRADRTAAGIALVMGGLAAKSGDAAVAKKVSQPDRPRSLYHLEGRWPISGLLPAPKSSERPQSHPRDAAFRARAVIAADPAQDAHLGPARHPAVAVAWP